MSLECGTGGLLWAPGSCHGEKCMLGGEEAPAQSSSVSREGGKMSCLKKQKIRFYFWL